MAEKKMERSDSSSTLDGRNTVVSESWELVDSKAEKKIERSESASTLEGHDSDDGRSTVASSEGSELDKEMLAKLTARVAALETENKLLKEGSGLFICCNKCDVH
jgi:hypothetical protein